MLLVNKIYKMEDIIKAILLDISKEKNIDTEMINIFINDYEKANSEILSNKLIALVQKKYVENKKIKN